jgi:hypothetical protein
VSDIDEENLQVSFTGKFLVWRCFPDEMPWSIKSAWRQQSSMPLPVKVNRLSLIIMIMTIMMVKHDFIWHEI